MKGQARAICCMGAELISQDVENKWKQGIYTTDVLERWFKQGNVEKVFQVAPVVGASLTMIEESEKKNYICRVTGFDAFKNNGKRDEITEKALAYMSRNNRDEYYEVEKDKKQLLYFRSIKSSKICLNCHGNTKISNILWSHKQGENFVGIRLDKWKDGGESRGAYEVVQPIENINTYQGMLDAVYALF